MKQQQHVCQHTMSGKPACRECRTLGIVPSITRSPNMRGPGGRAAVLRFESLMANLSKPITVKTVDGVRLLRGVV